jgi:hypothetical protein
MGRRREAVHIPNPGPGRQGRSHCGETPISRPREWTGLSIRLRFWCCGIAALNENHPVLLALRQRLAALSLQYRTFPDEHSRYNLVRHEQLIAQWVPSQDLRA